MFRKSNQTIYFVIPKKHQDTWSDAVKKVVIDKGPVKDIAHELTGGIDVWILQTWLMLTAASKEHDWKFELVDHGVPDAVCVFHFDSAKPCHGLFKGYPIVVQADRPKVPFAEIQIIQNPSHLQTERIRYIPLWPQPGIMPRDPKRKTTIQQMAIPGSTQYIPSCIHEKWFQKALEELDVQIKIMDEGHWFDYSDVDLVLAWRPSTSTRVLYTKPPSKLINAWHAQTPALLGPEPAYQTLRTHQDDYIEVHDPQGIIKHIRYLKENPAAYTAMLEHYKHQAKKYTSAHLVQEWCALFIHIQYLQEQQPKLHYRHFRYYYQKICNQMVKHIGLWND